MIPADRGLAALAEALHVRYNHAADPETAGVPPHPHRIADHHIADAAAILGNRAVFLPDGLTCQAAHDDSWATMDAQAATIAALRAALAKYGARHLGDCRASNPSDPCTCGLTALATAQEVAPEPWDDPHAVNDEHPCIVCGRTLSHDHDAVEFRAALDKAQEKKP
jgi:hypothetical protein